MKYKICYITTLPNTIRFFLAELISYLNEKKEFEITVICDTTQGFSRELPEGVRYIPVSMKRGYSLSGLKSTFELYQIFKREKFDLVQYSTTNAGVYSSISSRLAKVPLRIYCQWGLDYIHLHGPKKIVLEILERIICTNSTHIQPDSKENLQLSFKEHLYSPNKGSVIWHGSASGVDLKRFDIGKKVECRNIVRSKFDIPQNSFVFGYVGRILGQKGINELFDAFKQLICKYDNIKLLIVGDENNIVGIDLNRLSWAKNEANIIFAGFSCRPEEYYAAMDCFVFPSYHEGFGTAIIEAEALGLPVIASDIPGPREAMKDGFTGISVPSKNTEALTIAMQEMLDNRERTELYGKNAFEFVKNRFDQKILFEQIYENRKEILRKMK